MDINEIIHAAQISTNEQGSPIVILPLSLWQQLLNDLNTQPPQNERIIALLKRWQVEPDDQSAEWWDDFDADLKTNRTTFQRPNSGNATT